MYKLVLDKFGNEETRIVLWDIDTLDPDWWADKYPHAMGIELSFDDGVIPDGCEDFSIVIIVGYA